MTEHAAAKVLAGLGSAVYRLLDDADQRRWDHHAAVAAALDYPDCGGPARCGPCALEAERDRRQRYATELAEIQAQHRVSAERIARRRAADVRRVTATAAVSPTARCRVCTTAADGSRSCRRCGSTTIDATAAVDATLRAVNMAQTPPDRPPGTRQSAGQGRQPTSGAAGAPSRTGGRPAAVQVARDGPGGGRAPAPGTDPLAFAAALRALDRCPGCGEHGTAGHVCESCTCLG